jgi:hypothetical protein
VEKQQQPPPPPAPEIPKARTLPCAICRELEPLGDQHLSCRECRLTVHRNCYGIVDNRAPGKWTCDMCLNDKNPQLSIVSVFGFSHGGFGSADRNIALQVCPVPDRKHCTRLRRAAQGLDIS